MGIPRINHATLRTPRIVENAYVRDLHAIMTGVNQAVERHLGILPQRADAVHKSTHDFKSLGVRLDLMVAKHTATAFDTMAKKSVAHTGRALRGISPTDIGLGPVVDESRRANVDLMVKAGRDYAEQVRAILEEPENFGLRVEDLADQIQSRAGVSQSHAELIARDQTLKLNADLSRTRMQRVGVNRYTWSTSGDERVRESHAEVNGEEFSFDNPPPVGTNGEALNPGEDFQCRCVAIPVFEDEELE